MNKDFFEDKKDQVDELTGVYRRDVIVQYVDFLISENKPFSFAILDIDNFKYVNDDHGHLFGDEVLKAVAKKIQEEVENIGVVGRYGGDEFLITYPPSVTAGFGREHTCPCRGCSCS